MMNEIPNIKKRLSVDLSKIIEKPIREYYSLIKVLETKDKYLLHFVDRDENSDMYFGIIKETHDANGHYIHFSCKPLNSYKMDSVTTATKLGNFVNIFTQWLENIKYYEEDSILNDPILRGYKNEFYADFTITDENADFEGFSYSQQKQLSQFFENIYNDIDQIKDTKNDELINEIKADVLVLQNNITKETKNGLIKKFALILAKARKGSLKACDYILKEFSKEFLKEGAKFTFSYMKDNAHKLPEYLQQITEVLK